MPTTGTSSARDRKGAIVSIVALDTPERQRAASALYREVFGYRDPDHTVNPRLLQGLVDNAGTALGVFADDGRALGFCYGFTAVDGDGLYHYSQATVIAASEQGRGLGRALKAAQADVARSFGARSMRWTYDPHLVRNAHFNLDVLGAVGRSFREAYYGVTGTDRLIVDWPLEREREASVASLRAGALRAAAGIDIPTDTVAIAGTDDWRALAAPLDGGVIAPAHRPAVRDAIVEALAEGLRALSCRTVSRPVGAADRVAASAVYVFGRE